jgi:hypothetical protein
MRFSNELGSPRQPGAGPADRAHSAGAQWGDRRHRQPGRFFEHLGSSHRCARRPFPDHHHYQPQELKLPGAEVIVMTEKDAVKCAAFADSRMWFMRVEAILPREFDEFLVDRIDRSFRRADGSQAA